MNGLVQKVRIEWYGPFDPYDYYPETYFYMVYDKKQRVILYIGQAYRQPVRNRILQHVWGDLWDWIRRSKSIHVKDVAIKVGDLTRIGQQRVSKELIDDIESLMIIVLQPPGNIKNTRTYSGRELQIENTGKCSPLPKRISTKDLD